MSASDPIDLFYETIPVIKIAVILASFTLVLPDFSVRGVLKSLIHPVLPLAPLLVVLLLAWVWLCFVSVHVPEPYLDEVFHIPQAQKYCDGKWFEWDDKITTPPGLYGLSLLELRTAVDPLKRVCSAFNLRSVNAWCAMRIAFMAGFCRYKIELNQIKPRSLSQKVPVSTYPIHTGLNIALFPVLFFFSGLYYTDLMSTLAVLMAYSNHLDRVSRPRSSAKNDIVTLFLGILALFMRQTNIFWVVVYMGGLEAVHAVKTAASNLPKYRISDSPKTAVWRYFFNASLGDVHDPPVSEVWPDDLFFTAVSVAAAVVWNPLRVLRQVWPHIATLCAFAGFVAWNGGVVLGDKSNHVATLHLAQMLYIWPLFAFFSAPLLLPAAISILQGAFALIGRPFRRSTEKSPLAAHATGALGGTQEPVFKRTKHNYVDFSRSDEVQQSFGIAPQYTAGFAPLWRVVILLGLLPVNAGIFFGIVKSNTIIHPFTLADNRHYMFYVFRYTIRRPGLFRYYLIAPYLLSAALVIRTLTMGDGTASTVAGSFFNHPFLQPPPAEAPPSVLERTCNKAESSADSQREAKVESTSKTLKHVPHMLKTRLDEAPSASSTAPLTTALLLILATALSLVTAPLVEPRYFIIPWVMWRLHVPAWSTDRLPRKLWRVPVLRQILLLGRVVDLRLVLETVWFCAINYVTMHIFIIRPFQWRSEDGTLLDEGRLQRFMW